LAGDAQLRNTPDDEKPPLVTWGHCAPFGKGTTYAGEGGMRASFVLREQGKPLARLSSKSILNSKWELTYDECRIELGQRKRAFGYEVKDMVTGVSLGWMTYPYIGCQYHHPSGSIYTVDYEQGLYRFLDSTGWGLASLRHHRGAIVVDGGFNLIDRKDLDPHQFMIWAILLLVAVFSRAW
jgi:hypothetical protein